MEREDILLRELGSIAHSLKGIDITLEQIDSKMPFEERELAADKAEMSTALRNIRLIANTVSLHQEQRLTNICEVVKEVLGDDD